MSSPFWLRSLERRSVVLVLATVLGAGTAACRGAATAPSARPRVAPPNPTPLPRKLDCSNRAPDVDAACIYSGGVIPVRVRLP
jgi:hypothetical protein